MPPDAVMHCTVQVGSSQFMASDGGCSGKTNFSGVSLSLTVDNVEAAEKSFKALGEGGQITMPLTQTAKVVMATQGTAALATLGLVVARAVNILG